MNVKALVPGPVKNKINRFLAERKKHRLFGEFAPLVPPQEAMFDGPPSYEEFKKNGDEFLKIYRDICGLKPDEKMLDVGSGIGRKTLPLTRYLNENGQYEGIEIAKAGVDWCTAKITRSYPNFRFKHIDVYNKLYNPAGKTGASDYRFPFPDDAFTFVMLGSVFTHMLPRDLENYLGEIRRVMQPRGRCLISYFLLNDESLRLMEAGKSKQEFKYQIDQYRVFSREVPEDAIAFEEDWVRNLYHRMGLEIQRVDYGSWCGRGNYLSYQDLILALKA